MHGKSEFRGTGGSHLWLAMWTGILTAITAGILWSAAYVAQQRWIAKNGFIDGKQLVFTGTGMGLFSLWLKIILLSLITVRIYGPGGWCALTRWQVGNSYFADPGDVETI